MTVSIDIYCIHILISYDYTCFVKVNYMYMQDRQVASKDVLMHADDIVDIVAHEV